MKRYCNTCEKTTLHETQQNGIICTKCGEPTNVQISLENEVEYEPIYCPACGNCDICEVSDKEYKFICHDCLAKFNK